MISTINCPACQMPTMSIDSRTFGMGQPATCSHCKAQISLFDSAKEKFVKTASEFDELKQKVGR